MTPAPRLARSAGVIGVATMTSRVLGLVREQVLAYYFGAGDAMDAFRVAVRIPNLLRDLFAEGAMSSALVPVFTATLRQEGRERAWRLGSAVVNVALLLTGVATLAGIVWAGPLVRALAGDYADVPGKFDLTVRLSQIALPFLPLVVMAAACMGMLNALGHFFVPALSPAMFNVGSILFVIALVPMAGSLGVEPISLVAVGMIAGGAGQVALQWPALRRQGFRYGLHLDLHDPALRRVLWLMAPGTVGLAATQLNALITTILAARVGTGAVSWLDYAFRLLYLPIGVFGLAVATATTAAVSAQLATGERRRVGQTLTQAIGLTALLNLPATAGLMLLAEPIVRLVFERGSFTPADTTATAGALRFYALGLLGYSVSRIVAPTFAALGHLRAPLMVSGVSVATNAALGLLLMPSMGVEGLALSTSLAILCNAGLLVVLVGRELGGLDPTGLSVLARVGVVTGLMAVVTWVADRVLPGAQASGVLAQAVRLLLLMTTGAVTVAAIAAMLRIPPLDGGWPGLIARLRRQRPATS